MVKNEDAKIRENWIEVPAAPTASYFVRPVSTLCQGAYHNLPHRVSQCMI